MFWHSLVACYLLCSIVVWLFNICSILALFLSMGACSCPALCHICGSLCHCTCLGYVCVVLEALVVGCSVRVAGSFSCFPTGLGEGDLCVMGNIVGLGAVGACGWVMGW